MQVKLLLQSRLTHSQDLPNLQNTAPCYFCHSTGSLNSLTEKYLLFAWNSCKNTTAIVSSYRPCIKGKLERVNKITLKMPLSDTYICHSLFSLSTSSRYLLKWNPNFLCWQSNYKFWQLSSTVWMAASWLLCGLKKFPLYLPRTRATNYHRWCVMCKPCTYYACVKNVFAPM